MRKRWRQRLTSARTIGQSRSPKRRAAAPRPSSKAPRQKAKPIRRESEQAAQREVAVLIRRNCRARRTGSAAPLHPAPGSADSAASGKRGRRAAAPARETTQLPRHSETLLPSTRLGNSEQRTLALAADPVGHELLSAETLAQWSQEAGVQFRRAPEAAATWGGLLATSGRVRVDATFPTQLATAQARLREQVFQMLSKGKP